MASATTTMIDVKLIDGRFVVTLEKCILVLTKAEFVQALRRGKGFKRGQQLQDRLAKAQEDR
ncbi:MAG TPA: hypothetical protein VGC99_28825 [Candidatus Tectomicrobia bacterium]|jgi:hypothetical protein